MRAAWTAALLITSFGLAPAVRAQSEGESISEREQSAPAEETDTRPLRSRRSFLVSLVGSSILEAPAPVFGPHLVLNVTRVLAVDLSAETQIRTTLAMGGLR